MIHVSATFGLSSGINIHCLKPR